MFLPGKSHGQRNLIGYSPWGGKEADTTEQLHFQFFFPCNSNCHCSVLHFASGFWVLLALRPELLAAQQSLIANILFLNSVMMFWIRVPESPSLHVTSQPWLVGKCQEFYQSSVVCWVTETHLNWFMWKIRTVLKGTLNARAHRPGSRNWKTIQNPGSCLLPLLVLCSLQTFPSSPFFCFCFCFCLCFSAEWLPGFSLLTAADGMVSRLTWYICQDKASL